MNCDCFTSKNVQVSIEMNPSSNLKILICNSKKVQVGKEQEKTQSEKDSHSKIRDGKKN